MLPWYGVIAIVASFIGLGLLIVAFGQRKRSLAACRWPIVQGIVRDAKVIRYPDGLSGNGPVSYMAHVKYEYSVGDRVYSGDCISDGMPADQVRKHPDALVLRYATGNVAQVHHHPTDPARSVLEIHHRGAGSAAATLGLMLVAGGGIAAVLMVLMTVMNQS